MDYFQFMSNNINKNNRVKREKRGKNESIIPFYTDKNETDVLEVGIDEAGRGPLFGRVYVACVILPKDNSNFNFVNIKDSKRYTSKKKLLEVYEYIKKEAIEYSVHYEDEEYIDKYNILETTLQSMHKCLMKLEKTPNFIVVDGDKFRPYKDIPHKCIEGGDDWYASIAAASILAKVERDLYIEKLCLENPYLNTRYNLNKNKGYGTKEHLEGIRNYGITKWHRKTFGICKNYS